MIASSTPPWAAFALLGGMITDVVAPKKCVPVRRQQFRASPHRDIKRGKVTSP
jgi:hypothetical protein